MLNVSQNIFLEKEEINKLQSMLINDSKAYILKSLFTAYGILNNTANDFLVEAGTSSGTFKITTDSVAMDSDLNLIRLYNFDNFPVTNDSLWYWVKISHRYLNCEQGTLSVSTTGIVIGTNTLFTELLRSQSSKAPVKIIFYKEYVTGTPITVSNIGVYEVVQILSDTNIILSGDFVDESDLRYIIIGSNAIGTSLTDTQKLGLYAYDNVNITLIPESVTDTPPTSGYTSGKDFYIARVQNNSGTLTIQDKRANYYAAMGNIPTPDITALIAAVNTINNITIPNIISGADFEVGVIDSSFSATTLINCETTTKMIKAHVSGSGTSDLTINFTPHVNNKTMYVDSFLDAYGCGTLTIKDDAGSVLFTKDHHGIANTARHRITFKSLNNVWYIVHFEEILTP